MDSVLKISIEDIEGLWKWFSFSEINLFSTFSERRNERAVIGHFDFKSRNSTFLILTLQLVFIVSRVSTSRQSCQKSSRRSSWKSSLPGLPPNRNAKSERRDLIRFRYLSQKCWSTNDWRRKMPTHSTSLAKYSQSQLTRKGTENEAYSVISQRLRGTCNRSLPNTHGIVVTKCLKHFNIYKSRLFVAI